MPLKIKTDVVQALDDWNAGKPVRSIELGHVHRMKEHPGGAPAIDFSKRYHNDQERAHAYCFYLLGKCAVETIPEDHDQFLAMTILYRTNFADLTEEEAVGAESLAWKALLVGWKRAIDGHADGRYIEVIRETQESKVPQAT
jgi:hypothetical protein